MSRRGPEARSFEQRPRVAAPGPSPSPGRTPDSHRRAPRPPDDRATAAGRPQRNRPADDHPVACDTADHAPSTGVSASRHPAPSIHCSDRADRRHHFTFDPLVDLSGDLVVRWRAIALAVVDAAHGPRPGGRPGPAGDLRADDVGVIAVGIVPGAVIGGRSGTGYSTPIFEASPPARCLDPAVGGMELGLAVVGGILTGVYVASLLGAPIGRWLHVAARRCCSPSAPANWR